MLFQSLCTVRISMINTSIDLKENKKKFRNPTHIIFMLPIRLLDYRAVRLAIGSQVQISLKFPLHGTSRTRSPLHSVYQTYLPKSCLFLGLLCWEVI